MDGNLGDRTLAAASEPGQAVSRLFYITDKVAGHRFLVDTGAEVSVIPASSLDRRHREMTSPLIAVNNSPINTYGQWSLTVNFGPRRTFRWLFLGADFLAFYSLDVDVQSRGLADMTASLSVHGVLSSATATGLRAFMPSSVYEKILADFPRLQDPTRDSPR